MLVLSCVAKVNYFRKLKAQLVLPSVRSPVLEFLSQLFNLLASLALHTRSLVVATNLPAPSNVILPYKVVFSYKYEPYRSIIC